MADIDSALRSWSTTASSNKPAGATSIGSGLDDNLRQVQATVRQYLASPGSTIASAATVDLSTADGHTIPISGTSTVTGYGTEVSGLEYLLTAVGAHVIKNSSALALPGAADITTAAGDYWLAESKGSGNWVIPFFTRANGQPVKAGTAGVGIAITGPSIAVSLSPMSTSLGADVSLSNTGTYFDGPSIAQGSTGTWFVAGTITVQDSAGVANISVKLWDGATVIASAIVTTPGANQAGVVALSGYIASPAGNLRISAKDGTATTGKIIFNSSGNSKDSTISAIRIA